MLFMRVFLTIVPSNLIIALGLSVILLDQLMVSLFTQCYSLLIISFFPFTCLWWVLEQQFNFFQIKLRRLQGLITIMFVKRSHLSYCTSFESEATRTGLGGWWASNNECLWHNLKKKKISLFSLYSFLDFKIIVSNPALHRKQVNLF